MKLLLYKPFYYDLNQCSDDINFYPDKNMIKNAINSFFLVSTPSNFRWLYTLKLETLKREYNRRENHNDYSPVYWKLPKPKEEVFKKLEVVSV